MKLKTIPLLVALSLVSFSSYARDKSAFDREKDILSCKIHIPGGKYGTFNQWSDWKKELETLTTANPDASEAEIKFAKLKFLKETASTIRDGASLNLTTENKDATAVIDVQVSDNCPAHIGSPCGSVKVIIQYMSLAGEKLEFRDSVILSSSAKFTMPIGSSYPFGITIDEERIKDDKVIKYHEEIDVTCKVDSIKN